MVCGVLRGSARVLGEPPELLGGILGPSGLQDPSRSHFVKIWPRLGGQVGAKRTPGRLSERYFGVSEKVFKIEGSWNPFPMVFWWLLGVLEAAKYCK